VFVRKARAAVGNLVAGAGCRRRLKCEASVHNAGTTFVHPEGAHNFVNTAAGKTEFYIVYFVPAGASPAAIDVTPAPAGCPA
jgi:hypothetical protein